MSILSNLSAVKTGPRFVLFAAVSGLLCGLPFTFPGLFFTAWFGIVPFFCTLLSDSFFGLKKRRAFGTGFVYGFVYCAGIYYWFLRLYPMEFVGFTPFEAGLTVMCAWLGISALQALCFGFGTLLFRFTGKKSPFALAVVFTLCEYSWHFGDFALPWCKIGLTQYKFLPFIQSSSLFGGMFVSFLIYLVGGFLASGRGKYYILSGVLFFSNLLYGFAVMNMPSQYTDTAQFSLIQGNIASSEKWSGSVGKTFELFRSLSLESCEDEPCDFTVWPESAVPVSVNSAFGKEFESIQKETDSIFLLGSFGYKEGKVSNSLFMIDQNGICEDFYSKRHLVPFGEYLPGGKVLKRLFPGLGNINMLSEDLYQGKTSGIFETPFGKIGGLICFDSIFPSLSRQSVKDGAQILVLITNDSWYFDSPAVYQHSAQAVFRAVENRRCVVRCANTGISMLIDEKGRITESLEPLKKGYVTGQMGFTDERTLYFYIGDMLVYVMIGYIIFLATEKLKKGDYLWKLKKSR
ncbi:MAG: apolipoprotein N-acyltransferase [Clostridia bacterium]|nr:apolipoprotein N-acyltransferase [Clostridia bacterium]